MSLPPIQLATTPDGGFTVTVMTGPGASPIALGKMLRIPYPQGASGEGYVLQSAFQPSVPGIYNAPDDCAQAILAAWAGFVDAWTRAVPKPDGEAVSP